MSLGFLLIDKECAVLLMILAASKYCGTKFTNPAFDKRHMKRRIGSKSKNDQMVNH